MTPIEVFSSILGWIYFLCWTVSFYPQAWQNFRTKSVTGLSVDYIVASVLGFLCYAVFAVCMYAVEEIRQEYRDKNDGEDNLVAINDVIFAVNAFFVTLVMLVQIIIYRKPNEKMSKLGMATSSFIVLLMGVGLGLAAGNVWSWFFYLYLLSYIKLGMTVVKYIPQVWLNYKRKSTAGWNVYNVILDFIGGLFSTAQLFLDAFIANHMAGIGGFIIKLGLGIVSIFFDIIFLLQHYVWFRHSGKDRVVVEPKDGEKELGELPTVMPEPKPEGPVTAAEVEMPMK